MKAFGLILLSACIMFFGMLSFLDYMFWDNFNLYSLVAFGLSLKIFLIVAIQHIITIKRIK